MVASFDNPSETPGPALSPDQSALLSLILSPNPLTADPTTLAHALKNPAFTDALEAHEAITAYRLRLQTAAANQKTITRLSAALDTTEDPVELRRICSVLVRLQGRPTRPTTLRAAPPADPGDQTDDTPPRPSRPPPPPPPPDPYDPATPDPTGPFQLPTPGPQVTPAQIVAAQLRTLRVTPDGGNPYKVVYETLTHPERVAGPDFGKVIPALLASAAWTHRRDPFTLEVIEHSPTLTDVRATFHPDQPSTGTPNPLPSCTFHFVRDRGLHPYKGDGWALTNITPHAPTPTTPPHDQRAPPPHRR